jgi:hypothetical protein
MRILYIAGRGRSGSTLLGNTLNEIDGFFHIGELRYVWQIAFLENRRCGCGNQVQSCPFWSSIMADTLDSLSSQDITAYEVASIDSSLPSHSELLFKILLGKKPDISTTYINSLSILYDFIFSELSTSYNYVVDSSKFPIHAYILKDILGFDVSVIHLLRDPRATTYSWRKHVKRGDFADRESVDMPRHGPFKEALKWEIWNRVIHRLFSGTENYHVVRYEDFAKGPRVSVDRILNSVSSESENPVQGQSINLSQNHALWGNPSRMKRGTTDIYLDEEWRRNIKQLDLLTVNTLAYLGLRRYGFK